MPLWSQSESPLTGLHGVCGLAPAASWPLLHVLANEIVADMPPGNPALLEQLPWDDIVRTVFTRAAAMGAQDCRGEEFQVKFLLLVLERQDLATLDGLRRSLAYMATVSPAIQHTLLGQGTDSWLRVVNRPGAYLLDTVYTMVLILCGHLTRRRRQNLQYEAVPNQNLHAVAVEVFPEEIIGRNLNYVGNSVESLAWLLLEADRCDMVVALAVHCDLVFRRDF